MTETAIKLAESSNLHTLHFENRQEQKTSPNLLVRWTIDPRMIEEMRNVEGKRAYIVILIGTLTPPEAVRRNKHHATQEERDAEDAAYDESSPCDERRYVCSCTDCSEGTYKYLQKDIHIFPVNKPIALIEIHRSGTFVIASTLVFSSALEQTYDTKEIRECLRCMSMDNALIWKLDSCRYGNRNIFFHPSSETSKITIDTSCFAKPRPKWLVWWATLATDQPVDECSLRKRYLLAFTVQAVIIGLWLILRTINGLLFAAYFFLTGWRHTTLTPLIHPFDQSIWGDSMPKLLEDSELRGLTSDIRDDPKGSFIQYDSKGGRRSRFGKIIHTPITWILLATLGCSWMKYPRTTNAALITTLICAVFVGIVIFLASRLIRYLESRPKKSKPDPTITYQRLIGAQTISSPSISPHHQDLGARAITAFYRAKAKICLPFADE